MGEMEKAFALDKEEGHAAIVATVQDLAKLGYRIEAISHSGCGELHITCYRPQVNEGGKKSFSWVDLSDDQNKAEKSE